MCISSSFPYVIQGLKKNTFWVQPSKWSDEWENISVMPCPLPQFISVSQILRDCPRLEMIRDSLCHRKARMPPLPEACDRCRSSTAPGEDRGSLRRSGVFILFICIYPGPSWSLIRLCHFLLLTFPQCADAHFDMFDWSRRMMVAFCAFFLACAVNTTSNFIVPKQQGLRKQCRVFGMWTPWQLWDDYGYNLWNSPSLPEVSKFKSCRHDVDIILRVAKATMSHSVLLTSNALTYR